MTILPRKSSFLSGLAGGAREGISMLVQQKLLQQQWNQFLDAYQARQGAAATGGAGIGGATQPNPMSDTGGGLRYSPQYGVGIGVAPGPTNPITPGQVPGLMGGSQTNPMMMRNGGGQPQQQNPMMQMLRALGGGIQGMGRGIGQGLGGMFGRRQQPDALAGNPFATMFGGGQQGAAGGQGGIDPRMLAMLQQILGGRSFR